MQQRRKEAHKTIVKRKVVAAVRPCTTRGKTKHMHAVALEAKPRVCALSICTSERGQRGLVLCRPPWPYYIIISSRLTGCPCCYTGQASKVATVAGLGLALSRASKDGGASTAGGDAHGDSQHK